MTTITIKRAGYRPLTPAELDAWLLNWATWLADRSDSDEPALMLLAPEHDYRSPQHWDKPVPRQMEPEAYEQSAVRVEKIVHADDFPYHWRMSVTTQHFYLSATKLSSLRVPFEQWLVKRAARADQSPRTYAMSLDLGLSRLASMLGRYRGELAT